MYKKLITKLSLFLILLVTLWSCQSENKIETVTINNYKNNALIIKVVVSTQSDANVKLAYWANDSTSKAPIIHTQLSKSKTKHAIFISNLLPQTEYCFQATSTIKSNSIKSKIYTFKTATLPNELQNQFRVTIPSPELLPSAFKKGFLVFSKKETPGAMYILDYKGNLRWYHTVPNAGAKMVRFTSEQTLLSIIGKSDEPTIYGSEILELDLKGDTLTHLKLGDGDFKSQIHHDILKITSNTIATITIDKKVVDLTSVGGKKQDTVNADGIVIFNRKGKQIWKWSVFDVLDPLKEKDILKKKSDWVHANSLSLDNNGNFIISFYNTGQIWNVDAKTGQVIWKLGTNGTLALPKDFSFSNSHAVHYNQQGNLMFFDNGVSREQSSIVAFSIDEINKKAKLDLNILLPKDIYSDRMGSAYAIDKNTFLVCSSKRRTSVLTNKNGQILWSLESTMPYRVQFISQEKIEPYLLPNDSN